MEKSFEDVFSISIQSQRTPSPFGQVLLSVMTSLMWTL